ncbi:cation-translocating P-type ATPase [Rodentibacter sp. Ppn85]|uniref:heavy metal translocating P-type ATPase n=1 Tax=Rodentibacter sp. Ppn85 TaxID=1908525 RepID=UPI0009849EF7|nr:cation-translocating P-type ATPase [Rodentibacter sp. Ppn85]OOF63984.1 copper-translocating P-type ATPase [Rodentibacter sp. Ppn85]
MKDCCSKEGKITFTPAEDTFYKVGTTCQTEKAHLHEHAPDSKQEHRCHHNHEHHDHNHKHDHGHSCTHKHTHGKESHEFEKVLDVPDGFILQRFYIQEMDCPTEEGVIRKKLDNHPDIKVMSFNLMKQVLQVIIREGSSLDMVKEIANLGMTAQALKDNTKTVPKNDEKNRTFLYRRLIPALLLAFSAEMIDWFSSNLHVYTGLPENGITIITAVISLLAVILAGIGTYKKGWIAIKNKTLNINALMSIATTGAILLGEFPETAMVMSLFALAEWIEAKSLDRARNAVQSLLALTPTTAIVQQADDSWSEMGADQITINSKIRVRPGEKIALDGIIEEGSSELNQSPVTGESLPVEKTVGDTVFAGSINESGSFIYRVTALANDSTLARIIHAVEEAQTTKAPTQRWIDKFAAIYTPSAVIFALLIALIPPFFDGQWTEWMKRGLTILVIACPCALVIATPVSVVSGLTAGLRRGMVIKGGVYLEQGRLLKAIALDKTGTITHGKPFLTDKIILNEECQVENFAYSLASHSDHPVSKAITALTGELKTVTDFTALPGRGSEGVIEGERYRLGNHRMIHEDGLCSPALESQIEHFEKQGKTVVGLTNEQHVLALFAVADTIKDTSRQAIASLHKLGVRTIMLTGDNNNTAQQIAQEAGIDTAIGEMLPENKLTEITRLNKQGATGMVGDGINDAPALAQADIGFAMGHGGSDSAIETADVAIMDDDLKKIPEFIKLSQRTYFILWQNILFALGIKVVFLILVLWGMSSMWMAVLADVGTSLLVVANGLRLLKTPDHLID